MTKDRWPGETQEEVDSRNQYLQSQPTEKPNTILRSAIIVFDVLSDLLFWWWIFD